MTHFRLLFFVFFALFSGFGLFAQLDYRLTLGGKTFDPTQLNMPRIESSEVANLFLIQFSGPIDRSWPPTLREMGFEVVSYIHPYAYVIWGRSSNLSRTRAFAPIRFSGAFLPEWRLSPEWPAVRGARIPVQLLIPLAADESAMLDQLASLGATSLQTARVGVFLAVSCELPASALQPAAALPGVYSVQPLLGDGGTRSELAAQVDVNGLDAQQVPIPGYLNYLTSLSLDGSGVVMANVDTGVDQNHPDLIARILPCSGSSCGFSTSSTHGTHTAALMAGDGASGVLDSGGFLRGLGVAPGAQLVEQVYTGLENAAGITLLMAESQRNGALLSSNSWGPSASAIGYDAATMAVDIGVRDADSDQSGNQPFSYILSIDNGNGGTSSQGTPDDAKNAITVGATKLQNNTGSQLFNFNDLASVTAHGPARDGRLLPLLVAPGCYVDSAIGGTSYGYRCGTSMASPQVSGAAALFIQYYRQLTDAAGQQRDPSPALIKAAFLPVAHDLAGQLDADGITLGHRPNSKQGWGRLNLQAVIEPESPVLYFDAPVIFEQSGEFWRTFLAPVDFAKPMRIMLTWTDAPGNGLGGSTPAWTNDLDLEVSHESTIYRGNYFGSDGWSQADGVKDEKNNAEGVILGPTPPGLVSVVVRAANLPGDGVANFGSLTDQDFALVCYNCQERVTFDMQPSAPRAEICTEGQASLTVTFHAIGNFNDDILLELLDLPTGVTALFTQQIIPGHGITGILFFADSSAQPGVYQVRLLGTGINTQTTESLTIPLHIFDQPPAAVELLAPAQWDNQAERRPFFQWSDLGVDIDYDLEISLDETFQQPVASYRTRALLFQPPNYLAPFTTYFWRVRAQNSCGQGLYSASGRFRTRLNPPILLVDDDSDAPDQRSAYTAVLDALGLSYDVWDTLSSTNEPSAEDLAAYQLVIWYSAAATNFSDPWAGPNEESEAALAHFLDNGGRLLLSSQDYLYDRGGVAHNQASWLMSNYLGVLQGTSEVGQTQVTGQAGPFAGLGPYQLSYPILNRSDSLVAGLDGETAFGGNRGPAGMLKTTAVYQAAYLCFPLEALALADRTAVINAFISVEPFETPQGCLSDQDLRIQAQNWPASASLADLLHCLHQYHAY